MGFDKKIRTQETIFAKWRRRVNFIMSLAVL